MPKPMAEDSEEKAAASQRQAYAGWAEKQAQAVPLFYQPWWLDAASGGPTYWGAALTQDGLGAWPYTRQRCLGLTLALGKPPFTPLLGPWLAPAAAGSQPGRILSQQHHCLEALADQLPWAPRRKATLPYGQTQALALQKLGWRIGSEFSYQLASNRSSVAALWERLDGSVRTDLRKAPPAGTIVELNDPLPFVTLNAKVYAHRKIRETFPAPVFQSLFLAAQQRAAARCWAYWEAKEPAPQAIVWLPFDAQRAYLLGAASHPGARRKSKAMTHLIWTAIQWCCEAQLTFDFEGSYLHGVEEYYRQWGPELVHYLTVSRWW
ncbi:MAG: GNAT family N-acetyltransferase [Lewinella sp.]|nr:GNAT family N-acetyltransferase [Lewinella sp.]